MVEEIKFSLWKNGVSLHTKAKFFSSRFIIWFLKRLSNDFDLFECQKDVIRPINHALIDDRTELSESDIASYKRCYVLDRLEKVYSFEEFLDMMRVDFGKVYVYTKGMLVNQIDLQSDKRILASIDFEPDGDVNCVWIEVLHQDFEICLIDLIKNYNCSQT